ncbi:MAG: PepSY domain-containing protein [Verrucomicrobiae bacterium]|nr:PepSY domain-containing protein [Verrucomicrobiae bacterium]
MTKRVWQVHSWMGLIAGLGLLVIGASGSILVFRQELQALLQPGLLRVEATPQGRLGQDLLLAGAVRHLPGYEVTGWLISQDPRLADLMYVVRHGTHQWRMITVNPYTAAVLAGPMDTKETFVGWLLELHYSFLADHWGVLLAGLFAALLCLLGLSGLWLYRDFWRHFFRLRWNRSARIFMSDTHKQVGILSVAFNLVLGFTGAYWNLPHAISHLTGGEPESTISGRLYGDSISLDALAAKAAATIPGFQITYVLLPYMEAGEIRLMGRVPSRNPLRSDYGSSVAFDPETGTFRSSSDIRTAGVWEQISDTFYPLHFGSFGGLPVKILWCFGGMAPGVLATTGFLLWWRRSRRATVTPGAVPPSS